MNRLRLPYGNRHKYTALSRELFWDTKEQNLYIWYEDHWILIAGHAKQFILEAGSNLEIVFDEETRRPVLRLKDDVDVDTVTLGKWYEKETWADGYGVSSTVYLTIEDKETVYFSTTGQSAEQEKFRYTGIANTGNLNEGDTGNQWYEMKMSAFRSFTGIPLVTGSNLDQFDDDSYVYWDIYINAEKQTFSIDRAFITHKQCDNEDDIVSEGRIWCHDPWWMTPNDRHTVDVSDGFKFLEHIFQSSSDNEPYQIGQKIEICSVYKVVPGGLISKETVKNRYTRWKGLVKIGEVDNCTFFPLMNYSLAGGLIGGEFLVKVFRKNFTEYGIYKATVSSTGSGSIFGSSDQNTKCTLNLVKTVNSNKLIGFKSQTTLEKEYTYETIEGGEYGISEEVSFTINSHDDIRLASENGVVTLNRRMDIINQSNLDNKELGCHWFELSMADFRAITGIPRVTGSNLDQFDDNSFVYFDIYFNDSDTAWSIDRVFVTHQKAYTDDEVVSEGRIWCHNPWWMTPNDKHTIDLSDGFTFIPTVFDDSANNTSYTPGSKYLIMYVYMVVPGQTTTVAHVTSSYLPPEKIEVWFKGWDARGKTKADFNISETDIESSTVIARS